MADIFKEGVYVIQNKDGSILRAEKQKASIYLYNFFYENLLRHRGQLSCKSFLPMIEWDAKSALTHNLCNGITSLCLVQNVLSYLEYMNLIAVLLIRIVYLSINKNTLRWHQHIQI